jgi:ribosomal protein S18 acetylase RimI-like enzyme
VTGAQNLVAFCGLFCGDCAGYSGAIADAARSLLAVLERYRFERTAGSLFQTELPDYGELERALRFMSGLRCEAVCRERVERCAIAQCCLDRGLQGCHECDRFRTCDTLAALEGLHGDACVRNLEAIRRVGPEEWAAGERRYWFGSDADEAPSGTRAARARAGEAQRSPERSAGRVSVCVREAATDNEYAAAAGLVREYAGSLTFALDFQDFEDEISSLPTHYAPPAGCVLLAYLGDLPVGCVAVRPLAGRVCEMKRLYVRPSARGRGAGRALAEAALAKARHIGYERMRLDTVRSMVEANALYRALGFEEIGPYRGNPLPDACFLEIDLARPRSPEAE